MIIKNKSFESKIKNLKINNCYFVIDFDQTITTVDSPTTLSLFARSKFYPEEYMKERSANFDYYRPLELDPTIDYETKKALMEEWHNKTNDLLIKYGVRKSHIKEIIYDMKMLKIREYFIEFINYLNEMHVPIIISSSGCGNFIKEELIKDKCYSDNIYINSNFLEFDQDKIVATSKKVVNSMSKKNMVLPERIERAIIDKDFAIIIGDQVNDIEMAENLPKKEVIALGFLESGVEKNKKIFEEKFDVTFTENENFKSIEKVLNLKK